MGDDPHMSTDWSIGPGEPTLEEHTVDRPRLVDRVLDAPARYVILSAPAGSGKTTLMAQVARRVRQHGGVVAWLSLEPSDHDAGRLLSRVAVALTVQAGGSAHRNTSTRPGIAAPADPLDEGFLRTLGALVSSAETPLWLLIDDAHELGPGPAYDGLVRLLDLMPEVRVVVAGRPVPRPVWARRVVEGQAVDLSAGSLDLTTEEVRAVLLSYGLPGDPADVEDVRRRTEGWVAGVRLFVLGLLRSPPRRGATATFPGNEPLVADYLGSEVLQGVGSDVRRFLFSTSVTPYLTVELAAVLSARSDAGAVLEGLTRSNILITRSDTTPTSWRYHPLLRDYLASTFSDLDLDGYHGAHALAARFFMDRQHLEPAMEHAGASRDPELVCALLERHGLATLMQGGWAPVSTAIDALPQEVRTTPLPRLLKAYIALHEGEVDVARVLLDPLAVVSRTATSHSSLFAGLLLYEARLTGGRGVAVEEAMRLDHVEDSTDESLLFLAMRGMMRLEGRDVLGAEADLDRALRGLLARDFDYLSMECMTHLVLTAAGRGRPTEMIRRTREAIDFATSRGWENTASMVPSYFIAAWGAWSARDDEAIDRNLTLAETLPGPTAPRITAYTKLLRAYVDYDRDRSYEVLVSRTRRVWSTVDEAAMTPNGISPLCLIELQFARHAGDAVWFRENVVRAERCLQGTPDLDVVRSWRHLEQGRVQLAHQTLSRVLTGALPVGLRAQVTAWQLACLTAMQLGRPTEAHAAILAILDLAAPSDLVRWVAAGPTDVLRLLTEGRGRFGPHDPFVDRVLVASRQLRGAPPDDGPVAHLTERERTVLRDLPSLMSLIEIAAAHHVSENTVKSQVRSIFQKLGVHGRREAVEKARRTGLL